jgi:hypothetical protein
MFRVHLILYMNYFICFIQKRKEDVPTQLLRLIFRVIHCRHKTITANLTAPYALHIKMKSHKLVLPLFAKY